MQYSKLSRLALIALVSLMGTGFTLSSPSATPLLAQRLADGDADSARYRVQFTATWSAETHPHPGDNFPTASAHFSPLIGAVHSSEASFWAPGELASAGIEQMAETGATGLLREEITAAMGNNSAVSVISGNGADSPGGTAIDEIKVNADFPLVTLVTMIAPSPDWFVGIHGESLLNEDELWVAEKTFTLYPYDAGTDSGIDYTSADTDTDPANLIASLRNQPPFSDAPIGTFTLTRIDEPKNTFYLPMMVRR